MLIIRIYSGGEDTQPHTHTHTHIMSPTYIKERTHTHTDTHTHIMAPVPHLYSGDTHTHTHTHRMTPTFIQEERTHRINTFNKINTFNTINTLNTMNTFNPPCGCTGKMLQLPSLYGPNTSSYWDVKKFSWTIGSFFTMFSDVLSPDSLR